MNSYAIDAESRVCAFHESVLAENWTNVYDAGGHRVAKGQIPSGSSCYTGTGFVPSETDILGQSGEQFSTLNASGWVRTNVYANGQLLATYEGSNVYFALNDWLGTKRVVTNGTGQVTNTYQSLWFGDAQNPSSGGPSDHHYTGQLRDIESGLNYFGARYYASNMGRFLSPDWSDGPDSIPNAKLSNPQTLNLYAYVRNNPLSRIDPDGHASWQPCADGSGSQCWSGDFNGEQNNGLTWSSRTNQWYQPINDPPLKDDTGTFLNMASMIDGAGEAASAVRGISSFAKFMAEDAAAAGAKAATDALVAPSWAASNPGGFINWLRNLSRDEVQLTSTQVDAIVAQAKQLGVDVRLDPPHPGTDWNVPHLNIGEANVHLEVPQGYTNPTIPQGSARRP